MNKVAFEVQVPRETVLPQSVTVAYCFFFLTGCTRLHPLAVCRSIDVEGGLQQCDIYVRTAVREILQEIRHSLFVLFVILVVVQ